MWEISSWKPWQVPSLDKLCHSFVYNKTKIECFLIYAHKKQHYASWPMLHNSGMPVVQIYKH